MFVLELFRDPVYYFTAVFTVTFSICLHELFHALAANYEGDTTAKDRGYFTMNPMVHMGKEALVILLLLGISWGACPVEPHRFRHRYGDALVSFAGPLANILLVIVFAILGTFIAFLFPQGPITGFLLFFCLITGVLNAGLFLLNMIPLPPLDGATILQDFLPQTKAFYSKLGQYGLAILFLLFFIIPGFGTVFWGAARTINDSVISILLGALGISY